MPDHVHAPGVDGLSQNFNPPIKILVGEGINDMNSHTERTSMWLQFSSISEHQVAYARYVIFVLQDIG